jgi:threonine dehydratase
VLEPGGAAALAAALAGKVPVDEDTVIMLTGGNADPEAFARTISETAVTKASSAAHGPAR